MNVCGTLQSLKNKDAFLVTQFPVEDTVIDFWRMMEDNDSNTIIVFATDQQLKV